MEQFCQFFVVRQQHAHSWVEAQLPGQGWVIFDPTPPQNSSPRLPVLFKLRRFFDGLDMDFGKYVLEYDVLAQQRLSDRMSSLFPRKAQPGRAASPDSDAAGELATDCGDAARADDAGCAVVAGAATAANRAGTAIARCNRGKGLLRQALVTLEGAALCEGRARRSRCCRSGLWMSDPCAPPFAKLVELYYAHRFGDLPLDRVEVSRLLREIVTLAGSILRASSLPS